MFSLLFGLLMPKLFMCIEEPPKGGNEPPKGGDEPKLTQAQVDAVVQERLQREREKYADYDDLKKFKTEHEKLSDEANKKKLEEEGKYKELEQTWQKEKQQYLDNIEKAKKDNNDLKIDNALSVEIMKVNAYPEAKDVIRPLVVLDDNGMPKIPGKDANGIDTQLPLEEGIKKFLEARPHLIKANQKPGGGTPPAGGAGGGDAVKDLTALNSELINATTARDYKKVEEIKKQLNAYFISKGITRRI